MRYTLYVKKDFPWVGGLIEPSGDEPFDLSNDITFPLAPSTVRLWQTFFSYPACFLVCTDTEQSACLYTFAFVVYVCDRGSNILVCLRYSNTMMLNYLK